MTVAPFAPGTAAPAESGPLDPGGLTGEWVSVSGIPGGVSRIRVRTEGERVLVAAAGGPTGRAEWPEVTARPVFTTGPRSREAIGFFAVFETGECDVEVQSYMGLGVLVLHTFFHFTDGSGRRDYFSREFYFPAGRTREGGREVALPEGWLTGPPDPSGLAGRWPNVDPRATGIESLTFRPGPEGLVVGARGWDPDGPLDWGEAGTRLFTDVTEPDGLPALLTSFDRGPLRVHLQARLYLGMMVVLEYAESLDGDRPSFYMRECFRR